MNGEPAAIRDTLRFGKEQGKPGVPEELGIEIGITDRAAIYAEAVTCAVFTEPWAGLLDGRKIRGATVFTAPRAGIRFKP